MNYQGKTIWITGASSGIGAALAFEYAEQQANLVLSSRNVTQLNLVKEQCLAKGANKVWIVPLDLLQYESLEAIVTNHVKVIGNIDILINNGGISQRSTIQETNLSIDKHIMAVNFFGAVAMTKALLSHMLKNKSGKIVAISSVSGKLAPPYRSAYAASKHALAAYFEVLELELIHTNIGVTIFYPGYIKTNFSKHALTKDGTPHAKMDQGQEGGMSVTLFAKKAVHAIEKNKREVIIGGKETLGIYLKRFFPKLLHWYLKQQVGKQHSS